jgi:hypothetical protein
VANQPFSQSPFVSEEQDASELRKPVGAILKGAEDCCPVGDRERDDAAFVVVGVFEDFGCVAEPFRAEAPGELEHETVRDREAGEEHLLNSPTFAGTM